MRFEYTILATNENAITGDTKIAQGLGAMITVTAVDEEAAMEKAKQAINRMNYYIIDVREVDTESEVLRQAMHDMIMKTNETNRAIKEKILDE